MASFKVYMHKFPNNKVYIGITSQTLNRRWRNGYGYKGQAVYNAILKYGWNNIKHIVLFENLTKKEAEEKEIELIKLFNSTSHKNGYNVETGGYNFTYISRKKLKQVGENKFKNGYNLTKEQMENLKNAHIKARSKPIICIETKICYLNSEEAERITGIKACNINRCCNKKQYRKTAGGYHWNYLNEGGEIT